MTTKKPALVPGSIEHINANIQSIATKGAQFDKLVQETALHVLSHAHKNNDLDVVNRLLVSMPRGSKGQSLALWFCKHGALQPNKERDTELVRTKPLVWLKGGLWKFEEAKTKLWHSMLKDKPLIEVYDIEAKFAAFMKQVIANKDKVTNPVLLAALQNVKTTSEV
jgi:hypothetical protein